MIFIFLILISIPFVVMSFNSAFIIKLFQSDSVIVFGKKGKGKDLLFQHVIKKRKKPYYSNVPYGYKYEFLSMSDISLDPNTYESFIDDTIIKVPNKLKDKQDYYISDAGVYLPSQYHSLLDKKYKSFPIFYALSRHLNLMNIHMNTQSLTRPWDKIREQAGYYIQAVGKISLPFIIFHRVRIYDRYQTAKMEVRPLKRVMSNQFNNAISRQHESNNGLIKEKWIFTLKRNIKYDTRYFKNIVYQQPKSKVVNSDNSNKKN